MDELYGENGTADEAVLSFIGRTKSSSVCGGGSGKAGAWWFSWTAPGSVGFYRNLGCW